MKQTNRLFVAYKPPFLSSNKFLNILRFRYGNIRHAGFSGTLDPFAKGCLIVAFGQYTKLFDYLQKAPKTYQATIWLGAKSDSLDIERFCGADPIKPLDLNAIRPALDLFKGKQRQTPPKFSALRVDGTRAYKLARGGAEFELASREIYINQIDLINYCHPFLTIKCTVSEGTYVRTLGSDIAQKLGTTGILSSLERISEGEFAYADEKALNPLEYLNISPNFTNRSDYELSFGARLSIDDLAIKDDGTYYIEAKEFFVIVEIKDSVVKYRCGAIAKGDLWSIQHQQK